jgi:hypothetical protein
VCWILRCRWGLQTRVHVPYWRGSRKRAWHVGWALNPSLTRTVTVERVDGGELQRDLGRCLRAPLRQGGGAPPDFGEDDFEALPTRGSALLRSREDDFEAAPDEGVGLPDLREDDFEERRAIGSLSRRRGARESPLPPQHPVGRHPRFWVRMNFEAPRRVGRE